MQLRCKDAEYIKNIFLESYKLSFCAVSRDYGVANVVKKSGSKVPGGLWKISEEDEKVLDDYEGYPNLYSKENFNTKVNLLSNRELEELINFLKSTIDMILSNSNTPMILFNKFSSLIFDQALSLDNFVNSSLISSKFSTLVFVFPSR